MLGEKQECYLCAMQPQLKSFFTCSNRLHNSRSSSLFSQFGLLEEPVVLLLDEEDSSTAATSGRNRVLTQHLLLHDQHAGSLNAAYKLKRNKKKTFPTDLAESDIFLTQSTEPQAVQLGIHFYVFLSFA